jgi:hypothetical protein
MIKKEVKNFSEVLTSTKRTKITNSVTSLHVKPTMKRHLKLNTYIANQDNISKGQNVIQLEELRDKNGIFNLY